MNLVFRSNKWASNLKLLCISEAKEVYNKTKN